MFTQLKNVQTGDVVLIEQNWKIWVWADLLRINFLKTWGNKKTKSKNVACSNLRNCKLFSDFYFSYIRGYINVLRGGNKETYCFKCKKYTESKNLDATKTKDRKIILLLKFEVLDSKKLKFINRQGESGLLSSLGIEITLSKITLIENILF